MRLINASPAGSGDVYVIPLGNQFTDDSNEYNFRYLYDHTVPAHILRAAEPGCGRAALHQAGRRQSG